MFASKCCARMGRSRGGFGLAVPPQSLRYCLIASIAEIFVALRAG